MFAANIWVLVKAGFEFVPLLVWPVLLFLAVRPLKVARWAQALLGAVLLFATQKFLIYRFVGGDSFVPDLPERFVNLTGWTYSSSMIFFGLVCVWSLAKFACRPLSRTARDGGGASAVARDRIVIPGLAVLAMAVAGWGVWTGVRVPDIRRVEIPVTGLPAAFDGFRIVQLTDLHCSSAARKGRTAGIVAQVNALDPDLVCITGDFVDGSPAQRAEDLAPLRDLKARHGVFGCSGNHEYIYSYPAWRAVYAACGVTMLDNAHRVIEKDGARLALGGVVDFASAWKTPGGERPDVRKAFAGAPADACRVLLQHQPQRSRRNAEHGVRLQLTGHTHGGAIRGLDLLVARMGNEGLVRGLYRLGDMALYVSPGTGQWAGFPLRLGVPAEITEIVLRSPSAR